MQAALLSASLLLVLGMLGSFLWLSLVRTRHQSEAVAVETADETA